jgi:hypothetical protein
MFARSTDGGQTFSTAQRINDDPVNPNKWHWFGTLAVAPNGRIDSVWFDTRNAANNTDSQLFYSYSTDGGVTWSPNVPVSGAFTPFEGYPVQNKIGDYMTIVSDNTGGDVAFPATFNFNPGTGAARARCLFRSRSTGAVFQRQRQRQRRLPRLLLLPPQLLPLRQGRRPRRDPFPRPGRVPHPGRDRDDARVVSR